MRVSFSCFFRSFLTAFTLIGNVKRIGQKNLPIYFGICYNTDTYCKGELAVQYARQILDDVNTMTDAIQSYDRSLHTISIGTCAPGPLLELLPELTERFYGMALNSETVPLECLLPGLEKGTYQIIITDQEVTAPDILCQAFCTEELYLTVPPAHPLANSKEGIYLDDLAGETMLLFKEIGIWKERVISKMPETNFILQDQDETFSALIQASALPAFASDLTLKHSEQWAERTNRLVLPILDPEAHISFYCCVHKSHKTYLPQSGHLFIPEDLPPVRWQKKISSQMRYKSQNS